MPLAQICVHNKVLIIVKTYIKQVFISKNKQLTKFFNLKT